MAEYLVTWSIDIDADSPEDAAAQALEIHRDPDSIATIFKVRHKSSGVTIFVDTLDQQDIDNE